MLWLCVATQSHKYFHLVARSLALHERLTLTSGQQNDSCTTASFGGPTAVSQSAAPLLSQSASGSLCESTWALVRRVGGPLHHKPPGGIVYSIMQPQKITIGGGGGGAGGGEGYWAHCHWLASGEIVLTGLGEKCCRFQWAVCALCWGGGRWGRGRRRPEEPSPRL